MSTNKRGKYLEQVLLDNDMLIHNPNHPTSKKSTNVIDLITSSNKIANKITDVEVDTSFDFSDHYIVRFNLVFNKNTATRKKINWAGVTDSANKLFKTIIPINNDQEAETSAENFPRKCLDIISNNTKQININPYGIKIPQNIKELIYRKKKLSRLYSKYHDPLIKNQINSLNNQIKRFTKKSHINQKTT